MQLKNWSVLQLVDAVTKVKSEKVSTYLSKSMVYIVYNFLCTIIIRLSRPIVRPFLLLEGGALQL